MYKEGTACSDCPSGTSCSKRYPGLCTGSPGGTAAPEPPNPEGGQTRPQPNPNPNPAPEPSNNNNNNNNNSNNNNNNNRPDPNRSDCDGTCKYDCRDEGGCKVRYRNYGPGYSGSISGYCWSENFGGECSGTPHCCEKCKKWCEKENGNPEENESKKCMFYLISYTLSPNFGSFRLIDKLRVFLMKHKGCYYI